MKSARKVVILFSEIPDSAREDEKDTLTQVRAVSNALTSLGFEPVLLPFSLNLGEMTETFRKISPDIVFNLVESGYGQGRLIHLAPALMDALKIPYTGADTDATFLTSNKILAKKLLRLSGIPTPGWFTAKDRLEECAFVEGTYIIKSVWEHASVGLSQDSVVRVRNSAEMKDIIRAFRKRLGDECFAEEYIEGREFNLSLSEWQDEPEALPAAEIRFVNFSKEQFAIVDYNAKWKEDSPEYRNTVRSFQFSSDDDSLLARLKEIALACWKVFDLRGYARVDFRTDTNGKPFVLEVNTNPCLSPDAGFAAALAQAGISYEAAIERILRKVLSL